MLKWLLARKLRKKVESDLTDAHLMLATMKSKLVKEGSEATITCGEGVGQVAGLLAQRFRISVPAALDAHDLDGQNLADAADDLTAAMKRAGTMLNSEVQSVRTPAQAYTFGCIVLYQLYRLRFLSTLVSGEQQVEVNALADRVATFARLMAEIGAGVREPQLGQTPRKPTARL